MTDDQSTPIPGAGHDYIQLLSETVNPANSSLSLRIQLPMPKGRGLSLPFSFAYDSNSVRHLGGKGSGQAGWFSDASFLLAGGWSYSAPRLSQVFNAEQTTVNNQKYTCDYYTDYVFHGAAGDNHALYLAVFSPGTYPACESYFPLVQRLTGGDDLLQAVASNTTNPVPVVDADGTVYSFPYFGSEPDPNDSSGYSSLPTSIEDRNGNVITVTDNGGGGFTVTDTLKRQLIKASSFGSSSGDTIQVAPFPSASYSVTWGTASGNFSPNGTKIWNDGYCGGVQGDQDTNPVITAISLPDGEGSYTFQYESTYGLLAKITYPSGGYVSYTWGPNSQSEFGTVPDANGVANACGYRVDSPAVMHRYVSFDGTNIALEQDFSYSTSWDTTTPSHWDNKYATVTTTDERRNVAQETNYTYSPVLLGSQPDDPVYFGLQVPVEQTVTVDDWTTGNLLRKITKTWVDQYEMQGQQVVDNGTVTSDQFFVFGSGAQVTGKYECGSGQTCYNATQASPPTAYTRLTSTQYHSFPDTKIYPAGPSIFDRPASVIAYGGGSNRVAETDYSYDGSAPSGTTGVVSHDYTNYSSSNSNRGNATSMSKWVNTSGNSLTWNYTYDDTGQQLSMSDPKTNPTSYSYTDEFPACGSPSQTTNAYLTQITDAKTFTQNFTYRYCDGQLYSAQDWNTQTTTYSYSDSLNRLTGISYPDTGSTTYGYGSSSVCAQPSSTTILIQSGSNYTETATMDGVCHVTNTSVTSDPQGTDKVDTTYDGTGRVWTVSNPWRNSGDNTNGVTTYVYDALGRTTSVASPDGSTATTSYSGLSSTVIDGAGKKRTLTYDNLGRLASVTEDPSGLNYSSTYTYYLTDDLNTVTQGSQTRTFGYDSLSRLTSALNPESGTTSYTYPTSSGSGICSGDPSLPCTRTDNRSITTTYSYDALNRLTGKSYNDTPQTPSASFSYDESTATLGSWTSPSLNYPKGRLTHTTTMSGSTLLTATVQDYDKMGRTKDYWQCTPLNCGTSSIWAAAYNYDLAGDVTSWNHPGNFTISQPVDAARHITQVTSSLSDSTHPATLATGTCISNTSICYKAWGALKYLENGCVGSGCTSLQESYFYNTLLQPAVIELGTSATHAADSCRVYNYYANAANASACSETTWPTGSNNNGDVAGYYYVDNINSGLDHAAIYTYDGVNRLASAVATGSVAYNQAYAYTGYGSAGQYGNMSCTANPPEVKCLAPTYGATTNRITTSGYTYDLAGDVTGDGTTTYHWDAEGRLASLYNTQVKAYNTYNALGQRVRDSNSTGAATDEAYGAGGNLLWRYTGSSTDPNQRAFVPFNGRILAEYYGGSPGGTLFDHPDQLGSLSTASDYTGNHLAERLFYPFGELWTGADPNNFNIHRTFAQLPDYDAETDQYNTLARHYTPMGRWMSPDPFAASPLHIINPQRWNMYAHALNNPTTLVDPTGLDAIAVNFPNNNLGGHEAIISVHSNGQAEFASYGPRAGGTPYGEGQVTAINLITRVQFGSDGLPTDASYRAIAAEVGGIENNGPSTVRMNYFKTSESDTIALDAWIQRNKEASDRGRAPYYVFNRQNCATFCIVGLIQANAIQNQNISIVPNNLFDLLQLISTQNYSQGHTTPGEQVTTKILPCGPACPEGPEG